MIVSCALIRAYIPPKTGYNTNTHLNQVKPSSMVDWLQLGDIFGQNWMCTHFLLGMGIPSGHNLVTARTKPGTDMAILCESHGRIGDHPLPSPAGNRYTLRICPKTHRITHFDGADPIPLAHVLCRRRDQSVHPHLPGLHMYLQMHLHSYYGTMHTELLVLHHRYNQKIPVHACTYM